MDAYQKAINFLFNELPVFQHNGAGAYKPGLERVIEIADAFGNPHRKIKTIHVGGTNGKGSTAHTIAAVLQSAGYRTGLFTSPHLIDFRERIRINGEMISEEEVVKFVDRYHKMNLSCEPSFFELSTMMAFDHFARHRVDFAVIEVGLGGRLDSTNIITPEISVITNISLDHTALLGDTLEQIATEKAGIIKRNVPVVIGRADNPGVHKVFFDKALREEAEIVFADERKMFTEVERGENYLTYRNTFWGDIKGELTGDCQPENAATVMHTLDVLERIEAVQIPAEAVAQGFEHVTTLTGLMGRWSVVSREPVETVCDTGHNPGGWEFLSKRLSTIAETRRLHIVIGFVNDKDVSTILAMMPKGENVCYHFVNASVNRALPSEVLAEKATAAGLKGESCGSVAEGYKKALSEAGKGDMIFVGGSTFVVADLLTMLNEQR
jgi:dihydrofolate synthase/folylpolyglutamate synthase